MSTDNTPKDTDVPAKPDIEKLNRNIARIEELTQRLVGALARQRESNPSLDGPGHDLYARAAGAYLAEMMTHPSRIFEQQVGYWGKSLKHWIEVQENLAQGRILPPDNTAPDKRFRSPMWQAHPWFNFIKQQYLMSAEAITQAVDSLEGLEPRERQRVSFFTRQIIDLMSPANFLASNPDALQKALETDGQSLVDGLENLVRDIEANDGALAVTLCDPDAFEVGRNIATSEGAVVYQNRLFQLIQYAPRTEKVHKTPLIIFPPWINKYYILDLRPDNSLIRWITEQGFTLFVVSWVNPDDSLRDAGIDAYVEEGFLTAIAQVREITGEDRVNTVGYCIAGTMQSVMLAYMARKGDRSVRAATFFTALADFEDPGEMGVFLSDDFLSGIDAEVARRGFLPAFYLKRTFSYLRANDLVYGPAIRSYMMGEAPPAFDLLYWNGDSTNLAEAMAREYLHRLCVENELSRGCFTVLGENVNLHDIKTPICAIACETDHIAKWQSSFVGLNKFGGDKTFILSESGHIAGIVNPPSKNKYGHYINEARMKDPDSWKAGASFHQGSWWPRWKTWLARRSGKMVPARIPGDSGRKIIEAAPGSYVRRKAPD